MKSGLLLLSILLTLTACERAPQPEAVVAVEATPQPTPIATPEPVAVVTPPSPAPRELAPDGVFFLRRQASLTTPDGIAAYPPGTQVRRSEAGTYVAPDGAVLKLGSYEVTNDLAEARRLAQATAALRAAQARRLAPADPPPPPPPLATSSTRSRAAAPLTPRASATPAGATPTASSMQTSGGLGTSHSRTKDGWLWQKSANGEWVRLRPLN